MYCKEPWAEWKAGHSSCIFSSTSQGLSSFPLGMWRARKELEAGQSLVPERMDTGMKIWSEWVRNGQFRPADFSSNIWGYYKDRGAQESEWIIKGTETGRWQKCSTKQGWELHVSKVESKEQATVPTCLDIVKPWCWLLRPCLGWAQHRSLCMESSALSHESLWEEVGNQESTTPFSLGFPFCKMNTSDQVSKCHSRSKTLSNDSLTLSMNWARRVRLQFYKACPSWCMLWVRVFF